MTRRPLDPKKQRGVLIVAIMAGIAIMMILSTVAVQAWADITRRDREAEMMFRAQDITRALKRFQADRGKLPTELKELLEVGQKRPQYFIRQLWKDPLVKDGNWQLIYASPAGGFLDPTAAPGAPGSANPIPGGGMGGIGTGGIGTGAAPVPGIGAQPATGVTPTDASGFPSLNKPGQGQGELTGLPIAGVKSKCKDKPFRKFRDKETYAEWVFTIFDVDQKPGELAVGIASAPPGMPGAPGQVGAPGQTPANNPGGNPFGGNNPGSKLGGNPFGGSPGSTTPGSTFPPTGTNPPGSTFPPTGTTPPAGGKGN